MLQGKSFKLLKQFYTWTSPSLRGLFEKHKLVFSSMLCIEIMRQAELINDDEWNFFLRGAPAVDKVSLSQVVYLKKILLPYIGTA